MSVLKKPPDILMSVRKLYDSGQMEEKLNTLKLPEDIEDIKSQAMKVKQPEDICTHESHPKSKKMISKDKSNTSKENIQITKLSETLAADLILKDKASEEYWNNSSREISKKLLFPHQIDLAVLEQENFSVGFSNTSEGDSRFLKTRTTRILTKSSQKTYWKLSQSSQRDITDEESIITRKIRIHPNVEQKKLFAKCFGAHRYFYNKALDKFKENEKIEDVKEKVRANSFYSLRNAVVIKDSDLNETNIWMKEIPFDTRANAVKCFKTALTAAKSNFRNGNITKFEMKYRSKKKNTDVFYVDKGALKNSKIFVRRLKTNAALRAKKDKEFLDKSDGDFSIIKEKDGKYYICICVKVKKPKLKERTNICALDPGVRTFQTMYAQKSAGEFGYSTSEKLNRIYERIDKITSILALNKMPSRKRYKLEKRCAELRTKAKCIVDDLHWRTADLLTKHFQVILLPVFNTKRMVNNKSSALNRKTKRLMLGLKHYSFQQKLIYKANQRGRKVILCKEHYTTKCCGRCGELNHTIGAKKVFECSSCNLVADRDIHAARNILIRALSTYMGDGASGCMRPTRKLQNPVKMPSV